MQKILLSSTLCATMVCASMDILPTEKRTFEQSKFIPDISLILDASFVNRDIADDEVTHLEIPGIAHGLIGTHGHDGDTHISNNANNGFNLNYAELVLSSSVDPFFTMDGIFHYSENGVEIEELYFTSTAIGFGTKIKGGKFNSNFGYLNEQHYHSYSFADMPLVYESFLGMHGINEKGLQLQWTAPTSTYLMIGLEILQGDNEQMFGNQTIGFTEDGSISQYADAPSLFVTYAKTSFDIDDTTILAGVSYAKGTTRLDRSDEEENAYAISGDSILYGIDLTIKHYFNSYSFLSLQSEFLGRKIEGILYSDIDTSVMPYTFTAQDITKTQSGIYTQLIYANNKNWAMGLRYETFLKNDVILDNINSDEPTNLDKYSLMIEYNTSEFAKFRLQYNRNNALYNEKGEQQHVNTIILQANISIGAHAAHSF